MNNPTEEDVEAAKAYATLIECLSSNGIRGSDGITAMMGLIAQSMALPKESGYKEFCEFLDGAKEHYKDLFDEKSGK